MANNDFSFDFGFSAMDADELEAVQEVKAEAQTASATASDLEDRFNKLYNMVIPLLNNLKQNPEKDYIYWPKRLDKIEQFNDALDKVYKGS
tara:strand:- start:13384 stop:13656 length:273 start_codon:yes stop_codon:yes gene_type:complete